MESLIEPDEGPPEAKMGKKVADNRTKINKSTS